VLFCSDRVLSDAEVSAFEDALYPLWESACSRQGLVMNRRYGLQVVPAYGSVERYLAKFGRLPKWDISREMAKGHIKAGRSVAGELQLTPMQLLAAANAGDGQCGRLFIEFSDRFNGKAQMYWSPGLRARLLPDVQAVSDAEVVVSPDEAARIALGLSVPEWEAVKKMPAGRARLLEMVEAESGGSVQALLFIAEALAAFPAVVQRDLTKMAPDLRAAVAGLAAEQRERNRWIGPLVLSAATD
jgi:hypothetical protein